MIPKPKNRFHGLSKLEDLEAWINNAKGIPGILTRIWRRIQGQRAIGLAQMETNLTDYINQSKATMSSHRAQRHLTRGHLRRQIDKDTMTIKTFMKALRISKAAKVRITVDVTYHDGGYTSTYEDIDLGGFGASPAQQMALFEELNDDEPANSNSSSE